MRSATTCDPRRSATPRLLKVIDLLAFSSRTMTFTWPLEQLLVKWHQSKPQTGLRVGAEVFHKGRLLGKLSFAKMRRFIIGETPDEKTKQNKKMLIKYQLF